MSQPIEAEGKTVEEAIEAALLRLGATEDEVEIRILTEGGPRGILGRRVEPARVLVKLRDERTPEDIAAQADEEALAAAPAELKEQAAAPAELKEQAAAPEELKEQAAAAEEFASGLLEVMGLEGEVGSSVGPSSALLEISGPEMGLLIGKHGATLEALQDVVRAAVQRRVASRPRINVDIEGYRARQRARLERRAREAASKVRQSRRPQTLEPMTAFERKVVHDALSRFGGVTTTSEGEEPNRRVVIRPANP